MSTSVDLIPQQDLLQLCSPPSQSSAASDLKADTGKSDASVDWSSTLAWVLHGLNNSTEAGSSNTDPANTDIDLSIPAGKPEDAIQTALVESQWTPNAATIHARVASKAHLLLFNKIASGYIQHHPCCLIYTFVS